MVELLGCYLRLRAGGNETLTFEDRELLLRETADRHYGHTQAFWTEWEVRYPKNTDRFRDTIPTARMTLTMNYEGFMILYP